jgi:alginate O-acetyltransferase complex protein AlgI
MLFNSWIFLGFLAITFAAYYFGPWPGRHRLVCQIGLLTVASYTFYAWHTPWLVIILAASTWINAYVTLKLVNHATPQSRRRSWVTFAICTNLGVLAFFKYASLLLETVFPQSWISQWGFSPAQIPLPVGISFFTFQGISLVVDIYRAGPGGIEGLTSPNNRKESGWLMLRMAFFKAFFPQLIAGPIVKAHEFMHQIAAKTTRNIDWDYAIKKLILGYFLKMVVADNLHEATSSLSYPAFIGLPGINLLVLVYGFSFQIFADFCGYSLIAMGLAALFGYKLPINFNFPYLSKSITEFWRRWHISLSTWLREYLYFPLGGNRKGPARTYFNLFIVMLLGGLWHGAAWSYMIWGGAHGIFLALERAVGGVGQKWEAKFPGRSHPGTFLVSTLKIFITFNIVSLLWLLFQLPKFGDALLYLQELARWKSGMSPQSIFSILLFSSPIVIYHIHAAWRPVLWVPFQEKQPRLSNMATNAAYGLLLFLIVTNSGNPGAFIYFQF